MTRTNKRRELWMLALAAALISTGAAAQGAPAPVGPVPVGSAPVGPAPAAPPPIVTVPQGQTEAQRAAAARLGVPVSNERIADAIRQSGMGELQIRQRLEQAGLDPSMADPFFRGQAQGGTGGASPEFAAALRAMGVLSGDEAENALETRNASESTGAASSVFGKSLFNRSASVFDPVTSGPVDPSYRLGVGDALQVIITGQVELAYAPEIRRDGTIILPQLGQLALAGLTLEAARTAVTQRAALSYSGIRSGTSKLDLSITRIRSNAIFVIGEVEEPGAYQVNALATVFHALARAGGPRASGSFRRIELRRAGQVLKVLDLYEYILKGDASQDVRLEQGDVIYVPLNTRAVAISGGVRRPAVFELKEGEGFADLLRFAGGLTPRASVERVQVDRIVPPAERTPGKDRVLIDIRLGGSITTATAFPLVDGDRLRVFEIGDTRRNILSLSGAVFQPGDYEYRPGMTVDSLLAVGQGLLPSAIRDRILIQRMDPGTGRLVSHVVSLDGEPGRGFALMEFDRVAVLDIRRQYPERAVQVTGAVNLTGSREYVERESLRDLIDRSGGFVEGAQVVVLYRRTLGPTYSDTTSQTFTYAAASDFGVGGMADTVVMQPFDRVDVQLSPGYRRSRFVHIEGEFLYPGLYAINENVDRVRDLISKARLTPHAHAPSFQLKRRGELVAIDFQKAVAGETVNNMMLQDGDTMRISVNPRTIRVEGGVQQPAYLLYQPGLSVLDYIELAGGPVDRAQPRRAVVRYPSGFSRRVKPVLWAFTSQPEVVEGARIEVPVKPENQTTTVNDVLNRTLQIASTIASLAVAWAATQR